MIKTIPLMGASLKGFVRNWKSVVLLIGLPLILISVVFLSFNPEGIQKIPIGVIGSTGDFDIDEFKDVYFSYLSITKYGSLKDCMDELVKYNQYVCLEIQYENSFILNVYYDNTREPVIWEIIERIKSSVDYLQKQKSREMASDFLTKFGAALQKIGNFKTSLSNTNSEIDKYVYNTDNSIVKLQSAKNELSSTLYQMDQDIADVKSTKSNLKNQKNSFHFSSLNYLNSIENYANSITSPTEYLEISALNSIRSEIYSLRGQLNSYNSQANSYFIQADNKILEYEATSRKGKNYVSEIESGIGKLRGVKSELVSYKSQIKKSEDEISNINDEFVGISGLDAETLINPIVIRNKPTYIPAVSEEFIGDDKPDAQQIVKGINLISLQTLFPTMLSLITLFLSLLISSFICLSEINSSANQRIRLIKGIFFPEILSVYVSSLIIMVIPSFCVLLLGNFLFRIEIFKNSGIVFVILFLLSSIFVLLGIALAYLIKKESTTLLISTFILVFLIFISGFLLPIERMSKIPGFLAANFPGKIALSAFNKVVFYNQGFNALFNEFISLLVWFIVLIVIVIVVKKIRNV